MLRIIAHPLIADELTRLRQHDSTSPEFRIRLRRIASLMVPYVTETWLTRTVDCQTPLEIMDGTRLARPVTLVPILRAGLGLFDGFLDLLPEASIAHIGLARNETTLEPESYYLKHPPTLQDHEVILLDPMLATGGSAIHAVRAMQQAGAQHIRFVCLVAAPEGIRALQDAFPELPLFTAASDRCLNEQGFILPGLGDAGDRMFGTSA